MVEKKCASICVCKNSVVLHKLKACLDLHMQNACTMTNQLVQKRDENMICKADYLQKTVSNVYDIKIY